MPISEAYNEDCMIGMARYPDKFFDLAIVDPPYGINVHNSNYIVAQTKSTKQKNGSRLHVRNKGYHKGSWDSTMPPVEYFNELKRVSIHQIVWGWNYFGLNWGPGLIKWNKLQPVGVSFGKHEYAFCSLLDREIEFTYLWAGFQQGKSLREPEVSQGNKKLNEDRIHPTQKPTALYRWCLLKFGEVGDKILDTHMGSQSSRIAAYKMGFDYWGWELDPEYFKDGNKRFKEQTAQQNLFHP